MIVQDISFDSPEENILYDEVLLHLAQKADGGEVLRFWESAIPFVVLGRISSVQEDLYQEALCKDQVVVTRRSSGGGTVLQGPGCLNYALVLAKSQHKSISDLHQSYAYILEKVIGALAVAGVELMYLPISDMVLKKGHRKFSGNAQRRSRDYILHHGTILYDADMALIERYLRMPHKVPEYRQGRNHQNFLQNLSLAPSLIKERISQAFAPGCVLRSLQSNQQQVLRQFLENKEVLVEISKTSA